MTTIDTDVHCAPSSIAALAPYLDDYWREYIAGGNIGLSPTAGGAYPVEAATTATPTAREGGIFPPDSVDLLARQLLDTRHDTVTVLNCISTFSAGRNPYYEAAITRAVNDWMRVEWLDRDDRLRGSIVVPTLHIDAAVAEIERLGPDRRFVQVLLPVRGNDLRYGNLYFRRIFEAAARHDLVVGLHAWGRFGSAATQTGFTNTYLEDYLGNSQIVVQGQLVSLVSEGLFEQFPSLRVALLECGFSWLPGLLWRFEKDWKAVWREVPWLRQRPSEYIYENVRATIEPAQLPDQPEEIRTLLEMMRGSEFLMYASDFPHDHGDGGTRLLDVLDDDERAAVMGGNAMSMYRGLAPVESAARD